LQILLSMSSVHKVSGKKQSQLHVKKNICDKVSIVPEVLEAKFSIVLLLPSQLLFFVSTNS
jgi:uncharacterized protein YcgL (UPF0745 family)